MNENGDMGIMNSKQLNAIRIIYFATALMVGGFYEISSALVGALGIIWLIWYSKRNNRIKICLCWENVAILLIPAGYLVSIFFAIDRGIAVWGIAKYFVIIPVMIILQQLETADRQRILMDLPSIGAIMTVTAWLAGWIQFFQPNIYVNGRFSGWFQYPNTYAAFMLVCIVIVILKWHETRGYLLLPVLLFGLIQAGSRTVFLISIPTVIACICHEKKSISMSKIEMLKLEIRKFEILKLGIGVLIVIALSIVSEALIKKGAVSHMLDISVNSSTYLGRLLYWKDALPQIAKHPLGLGYLGYYMSQGSFQTGVYSVRYVHNDLLQLALDIGWIPAIVLIVAICRSIFSKKTDFLKRILLIVICAHGFFDFDFQYIFMYMIFILIFASDEGRCREIKADLKWVVSFSLITVCSIYLGMVSMLTELEKFETANQVYPWNTFAKMRLMENGSNDAEMTGYAEAIIEGNKYVAEAWDVLAYDGYRDGDYAKMINCKRKAIECNRYTIDEYIDYFYLLKNGVSRYMEEGDEESAKVCADEILKINTCLQELESETDSLAYRLADKPQLEMPEEYYDYCGIIEGKE